MKYVSTRGKDKEYTSAEVIARGLAEDGGLYVPTEIPHLSEEDLKAISQMTYQEQAAKILGMYLTDFSYEELLGYAKQAYSAKKFDNDQIVPIHALSDKEFILELWHGPTAAFKDMALQIMPYLLTASLKKCNEKREVCILVATSGDTGKAALEGFSDVDGVRIMVFFPEDGVSKTQKLQMITQEGNNVAVFGIDGNFDDAQTAVKSIFADKKINAKVNDNGFLFSSANSINWGRLAPQIVYYVSSYCALVNQKKIAWMDPVNVCVPTGNFGNILAAYFAKQMGVPIHKLICASNTNKVLTDFFDSSVYSIVDREFHVTTSPSMDILISSNLERMLYFASDRDSSAVNGYMSSLKEKKAYKTAATAYTKLKELFAAGFCDDVSSDRTIKDIYENCDYLIDPHTAVAVKVGKEYMEKAGDGIPTIIASTASPYKFSKSVLNALGYPTDADGIELFEMLESKTKTKAPKPLAALKGKKTRFGSVIKKDEIAEAVLNALNIQ